MTFTSSVFGLASKALDRLGRLLPDGAHDPLSTEPGEIGRPVDRVDGAPKVRGAVRYTADQDVADLTYAVAVGSTIARGRIAGIDTSEADAAPGVVLVMTHENAPPMKPTAAYATSRDHSARPP
jgi:xanthine dehydrogenase YagR molybdenum-binding subunit